MYQAARKLFFTDCQCAGDESETYEDLFAKLDANKDGKVDVSELRAGLAAMGVKTGKGAAQVRVTGNGHEGPHELETLSTVCTAVVLSWRKEEIGRQRFLSREL